MNGTTITTRRLTGLYGLLRIIVGVFALIAPNRLTTLWVGRIRPREASVVLGRALGARDVAIGAGTLASSLSDRPVSSWIVAGGSADAVDALVTATAWRRLPRKRRVLVLLAAGGGTAAAGMLLPLVERTEGTRR
ncbi:hypothetical protein [Haloechinothrix sp. LS1_15]|uniref:hypothetical protein n=1 Tax=Haloechinothrix sp. LS1_15 TaxID=2652248 RepID=UPI0029476235|nr:hypothetical protein [Haloechinothrix sp. LS1_15]MDV6014267.1 hypothetical protein [Haloechinothrix sp. LS1_15]